jgi:phage repressor protein C with HTH and peptisase S24 domain
LPRHALRAIGGRSPIQSAQIVDHLSFRADWLNRALNADPRSIALIEAAGDAMAPTIDDGDLVLCDLRDSRFRHDGVYVFRSGGILAIKRIQRQIDGMLLIRSDNPAYEPIKIKPDELSMLGRVIWIGGKP